MRILISCPNGWTCDGNFRFLFPSQSNSMASQLSQFSDLMNGPSSQIDAVPVPMKPEQIIQKVVDQTAEQVRMSFENFLETYKIIY